MGIVVSMGRGAKQGHGNPSAHGDEYFLPANKLWMCFACPGYIVSCVGSRCGQCVDKLECCCCLEEGLCRCVCPKTCCKTTHQFCCFDMHYGFPCDSEFPCACGACNCHWCGTPPTASSAKLGPSPAEDACFCCR